VKRVKPAKKSAPAAKRAKNLNISKKYVPIKIVKPMHSTTADAIRDIIHPLALKPAGSWTVADVKGCAAKLGNIASVVVTGSKPEAIATFQEWHSKWIAFFEAHPKVR
jgi:hypothetical protein